MRPQPVAHATLRTPRPGSCAPADFDALLSTVALLLGRSPPGAARFVTAYQQRSGHRSLPSLLDRWSLRCTAVVRAGALYGDDEDEPGGASIEVAEVERLPL